MKLEVKNKYASIINFGIIGVLAVILVAVFTQVKPSAAAPYLGCSPNGYIVRDVSGTQVDAIDMVTGQDTPSVGSFAGRQLNAIGYNPNDNHFYAWDLQNGVLVKVSSDLTTVTPFSGGTGGIVGYSGPTSGIFSGDVDTNGHYWFFVTNTWYEVDVSSPVPTFVGSGTAAPSSGSNGTDWAFVPGTNKLYRAMDNGGLIDIWSFDRTSKGYNLEGTVTNVVSTGPGNHGDMGAVYADPDGNFYMSSHNSGRLFRIDLGDAPSFTAVMLDAVDPNSNDGARCALASVPVDLGDAPASYDTAIADEGARHSIINFDIASSTASLMLGTHVDIDADGFPGSMADGDDNDHQGGAFVDDERGVTHIVATQGSSDPLTVPVRVTNTSSTAATLAGWIDLDNDNSFEPGERVTASVPAGFNGTQSLTFPAPASPYSANTYARFRLFSANDTSPAATSLLPTGPALGGEVEDVLVQLGTYDVVKTADPAEGTTIDPGTVVTYTLTINNTGSTALSNLKLDDDLTDVLDDAIVQGTPTVDPSGAGTAAISGNTLEFVGDLGIGATVKVTYAVKVKDGGTLGNASLHNVILANHSTSCHPSVSGGVATVSDPDCQTDHGINGLANTGSNIAWPLATAAGLFTVAGALLYRHRAVKVTS